MDILERLEREYWGCEPSINAASCARKGAKRVQYRHLANWSCECQYGRKGQNMAFTGETTSTAAPTTTTTTETTPNTTNSSSAQETSSKCVCAGGHRLIVGTLLGLVLPMLLGSLPILHDMFAVFALCINNDL
uniref:Uncharacterized protein n=1 Tax=Globodera pallida TaxID=36090 RepID=A0A183CKU1_GLOPA